MHQVFGVLCPMCVLLELARASSTPAVHGQLMPCCEALILLHPLLNSLQADLPACPTFSDSSSCLVPAHGTLWGHAGAHGMNWIGLLQSHHLALQVCMATEHCCAQLRITCRPHGVNLLAACRALPRPCVCFWSDCHCRQCVGGACGGDHAAGCHHPGQLAGLQGWRGQAGAAPALLLDEHDYTGAPCVIPPLLGGMFGPDVVTVPQLCHLNKWAHVMHRTVGQTALHVFSRAHPHKTCQAFDHHAHFVSCAVVVSHMCANAATSSLCRIQ